MHHGLFTCILLTICLSLFGQKKVDNLIQEGISLHDNGKFTAAVEKFNKALSHNDTAYLVHYELSMSYIYLNQYEKSVYHADQALKYSPVPMLEAYVTKASALDYLGKTRESIALMRDAIDSYGEYYLLYYNIGINHVKLNELELAKSAFVEAIRVKQDHASSHLMLANITHAQGKNIACILHLYYFLFNEPSSHRSADAYQMLREKLGLEQQADQPKEYKNISSDSLFHSIELLLASNAIPSALTKINEDNRVAQLAEASNILFSTLGDLQKEESIEGIYGQLYIPLYYDIVLNGHTAVFCHYISSGVEKESVPWLKKNEKEVESFNIWYSQR